MDYPISEHANDFSALRKEYMRGRLDEHQVETDPLVQFAVWMDQAIHSGIVEPNAMVLATCGKDMQPSARMVLLKDYGKEGFTFFTNYESRKGIQISENNKVALTFFWAELERQVRIEGEAQKINTESSDVYFDSRPLESRLSAVVSPQSKPIPDRAYLERLIEEKRKQLENTHFSRPQYWGGYTVKPHRMEFWQGRANRLHDRILYELQEDGSWKISRLAP